MIDFRYHLVSLIAVFLAIALGIVIGTTQLNGKVLDDLRGQVSSLEQDKRGLEDNTQQLQAQQDDANAFETAVAPALVKGSVDALVEALGRRRLVRKVPRLFQGFGAQGEAAGGNRRVELGQQRRRLVAHRAPLRAAG